MRKIQPIWSELTKRHHCFYNNKYNVYAFSWNEKRFLPFSELYVMNVNVFLFFALSFVWFCIPKCLNIHRNLIDDTLHKFSLFRWQETTASKQKKRQQNAKNQFLCVWTYDLPTNFTVCTTQFNACAHNIIGFSVNQQKHTYLFLYLYFVYQYWVQQTTKTQTNVA